MPALSLPFPDSSVDLHCVIEPVLFSTRESSKLPAFHKMGVTDQDLDEFEKLLGEINVTSANPNPEESVPVSSTTNLKGISQKVENGKSSSPATFRNYYHASQGQGTSPDRNSTFYGGMSYERSNSASVKLKSFQGSFDQKLGMNADLEGNKVTVKNNGQSPIKNVTRPNSNLSQNQSLASAFTQLNFKDEATHEQLSPSLVKSKALQNGTYILEAQYSNCVKQPISGLNSVSTMVPPLASPNTLSGMNLLSPRRNSMDKFNVEINAQENGNFLKFDVQELKKKQHGLCQPRENFECNFEEQQHTLPIYSTAMPVAPSLNTYQVLSSVPASGFEFSVAPYQQPYFLDAQSPVPFIQPPELSQSHIAWRYMEEERYYRMHQQYLYLQQFQNQGSLPNNVIQENGNSTIRPRTIRQPCFEMPITQEQDNKVPVWNNATFCRRLNASELALTGRGCRSYAQGFCGNEESCQFVHDQKQTSMNTSIHSSPTYSAKDFEAVQSFDKVGKHTFPEKILTRSHGLNSLRAINPGSIGEHELQTHANTGGRVLEDGNFHHQPSMLNDGSFQSRGCSGDILDLRHGNSRIQTPKYNTVDEVAGRIYRMAKDQNGCRFLQRKFTEGTADDIDKIFFEIIDHIVELMTDPFGNYLVQKLLEVCNEVQRMQILRAITRKPGDLVKISSDMHGTRAVQKVIETLKTPEQFSIVVSSLKPGIVSLIKDQNGNHVAQRCLQYLMPQHSEFLFEAVTAHCFELATDRHGCCVLQKCLSNSDFEQKRHLICEITSNALILSQDPFGNYVVQFILELQVPWATADTLDQLDGNYGNLSMQKYSSNVVEKCLKYGGEERRPRIIKELINSCLDQILLHPYGNYVIQAALNNSKGSLHAAVVEAIEPHVPALKTSPFGKKVLSCYSLKK